MASTKYNLLKTTSPEMTAKAGWRKVATVAYNNAAFNIAGLTAALEVYSLASREVIHDACIRVVTAFSGGVIATAVASVGITGTPAKYLAAASVAGTTPFGQANVTPIPESFSGATSIKLTLTTTVGLLNALTAGSLEVYLNVATLP